MREIDLPVAEGAAVVASLAERAAWVAAVADPPGSA